MVTIGAGLGLYLVSYGVAAQRSEIETLQRQIADGRQDIRALEAELRVRANLPQLERWNAEVLALSAPAPTQILGSAVQLASFQQHGVTPDAVEPKVRLAEDNLPLQAPEQPKLVKASYTPPAAPKRAVTEEASVEADDAALLPLVEERPEPGLFSAKFVAEIEAAAASERARLRKVSLR
jgi:hypothetical protein